MPRKPGIGPPILKIEGLSTGADPTLRDDFDGSPLAQPHARPPRIDDAIAHRDAQRRKAVHEQGLMLQITGILPVTDPALLEQRAKQANALKPNQAMLGTRLVMTMPPKPLRRM